MEPQHPQHLDLALLREPFDPVDVEWKPGATTRDKSRGLAMAYLTSRAIQDRLDDVCGPANWRNEFTRGPEGGVLCGISINVSGDPLNPQWVTKWDGAENTEVEAIKGGLSNAMKRAAVHWGIGRYLYNLPVQWVPLDERGRFAEPPRIPSRYLPQGATQPPRPSRRPAPQRPRNGRPSAPQDAYPTGRRMG